MAKGSYTINELDHEILRVCAAPKSAREISEELGANMKIVQWKVSQLKALGLLEKSLRQTKDEKRHSYKYIRVGDAISGNVSLKKEYQPLGICVMGVWM